MSDQPAQTVDLMQRCMAEIRVQADERRDRGEGDAKGLARRLERIAILAEKGLEGGAI